MTTNDVIDRLIDVGQDLPAYGEAISAWVVGNVWLLAVVPVAVAPIVLAISVACRRLTVTVSDTARTDGMYELRCGPTGGDHPAA
ncbi:hypothetical protein ACWCPZ_37025, partial [Streptomyces sp. NPDC002402]